MGVQDRRRRGGGVGGEKEENQVEEERTAESSEISSTMRRRRNISADNDGDTTATSMNDPFSLPFLPLLIHSLYPFFFTVHAALTQNKPTRSLWLILILVVCLLVATGVYMYFKN